MRRSKEQANVVERADKVIEAHIASQSDEGVTVVTADAREFLIDSRASSHVTGNSAGLKNVENQSVPCGVSTANVACLPVLESGTLQLESNEKVNGCLYEFPA
jgi:hypothetical protein